MPAFRIVLAVTISFVGILLTLPVLVLALPFFLFSLSVRAIAYLLEPTYIPWNEIIEFDPTIGWKPKANLDTHYLTLPKDGVFHTVTDPQGWPGKATLSQSKIIVIGDSFAFGYGVDIEDSFSEIDASVRVKSIGAPGYNMVQELLLMKQLSAKLRGKLVVWFICVENDLIDNLSPHTFSYRTPFLRRFRNGDDWKVVTHHLGPTKWFYMHDTYKNFPYQGGYLEVLAKLCGPSYLSQTAYSACEFLIREGRDVCSKTGAQLVVMTIPNPNQLSAQGREFLISRGADRNTFDPAFPDKKIGEICHRLDIEFLAARTFLDEDDYKELDPHWNKRGHQRISNALRDTYKDHMLRKTEEHSAYEFDKPELIQVV